MSAARLECKGDPEASLTAEEIVAKAKMVMSHGGVTDEALAEHVLALPDASVLPLFPLKATE